MASKRPEGRPRIHENVLSRWIDARGMTRAACAEALGVARNYLDLLCRGDRRPGLDLALRIQDLSGGKLTVAMLAKLRRRKPAPKKKGTPVVAKRRRVGV